MQNAITSFVLGFIVIMLIAVCQSPAFAAPASKATTSNYVSPQAGSADEEVPIATADKSEKHFHKARESFLKRDSAAAASEIRKGAAFVEVEARHATGQAKQALTNSAQELKKLADGVENGTVTSIQDLRRAFARADRALAEEHFQKAVESWSKKEVRKTGQDLKAAADDVELAVSWGGEKLNTTAQAAVKDARAVAAKLTEGAAWTREEVGKGLDAMSKEVGKLRERV